MKSMKTENKHSHFILELQRVELQRHSEYIETVKNAINLVLAGMLSKEDPYTFFKNDKSSLLILFRTD